MSGQTPSKPKKGEQLIRHLEGMIVSGQLAAGNQLPPLRELEKEFNLSYSTTQRCVSFLCARGLLEKNGKNIIIGRREKRDKRNFIHQVTVFIEPCRFKMQKTGLYLSALAGVQKAALNYNFSLVVSPFDLQDDDIAMIADRSRGSSGIILLLEFDWRFHEFSPPLPAVGVQICNNYNDRMSLLDIDPFSCAEQAIRYFQRCGIDRVKVFSNHRPSYLNRADAFLQRWQRLTGVRPELCVVESRDIRDLEFPEGSGIYFTSDSLAQFYISTYAEISGGRRLQDDYRIIAVDGKRFIDADFDVFPTIAVDWQEMGMAAFEECLALIEYPGRRRRRIWLPGTLFEN